MTTLNANPHIDINGFKEAGIVAAIEDPNAIDVGISRKEMKILLLCVTWNQKKTKSIV